MNYIFRIQGLSENVMMCITSYDSLCTERRVDAEWGIPLTGVTWELPLRFRVRPNWSDSICCSRIRMTKLIRHSTFGTTYMNFDNHRIQYLHAPSACSIPTYGILASVDTLLGSTFAPT